MLQRSNDTVRCDDGWPLAVSVVEPVGPPRAVVVVGHAMMVDRRTLDLQRAGLVSHLADRGLAVVAADLRGHGDSGPLAGDGGQWSYDDLVERDTSSLLAYARGRWPGLRLCAVGHSLFAHVALAHLTRHPDAALDGLVMLGGNVWGRRWEPDRLRWLEKRAILLSSLAVVRAVGRFPARRLRIGNTDEAAGYWRQLVGWSGQDEWLAGDGFSFSGHLHRVRTPLLSLVGGGDHLICNPASARGLLTDVRHAVVEVLGRADHMGLVTDARSRPIWDRVAEFVLRGA